MALVTPFTLGTSQGTYVLQRGSLQDGLMATPNPGTGSQPIAVTGFTTTTNKNGSTKTTTGTTFLGLTYQSNNGQYGTNATVTASKDFTGSNAIFNLNETESDRLTLSASNLNNITVNSGGGQDVLTLSGAVTGAFINAGAGKDSVNVAGNATSSRFDLGVDDDVLIFGGTIRSSVVVNLAAGGADLIQVSNSKANITGLIIQGANADDVLMIGSSVYSYTGASGSASQWVNVANPNDKRFFGV